MIWVVGSWTWVCVLRRLRLSVLRRARGREAELSLSLRVVSAWFGSAVWRGILGGGFGFARSIARVEFFHERALPLTPFNYY